MLAIPVMQLEKVRESAVVPKRANPSDSGLDVVADSFLRTYKYIEIPTTSEEGVFVGYDVSEVCKEGMLMEEYNVQKSITLEPNERVLIGTGWKATVGVGYEIQVRPRSGMALKEGLTVLNSPGTVDESYRNEIGVILINTSRVPRTIKLGERIAQLVVAPVVLSDCVVVENLNETERGEGGFGSTGKH